MPVPSLHRLEFGLTTWILILVFLIGQTTIIFFQFTKLGSFEADNSNLKAMTAKLRVEMATCLDEKMTYEDQADNRLGKANEDMDKWRGIAKDQADEVSSLRGKLVGLTNLSNSLDRRLAEFKLETETLKAEKEQLLRELLQSERYLKGISSRPPAFHAVKKIYNRRPAEQEADPEVRQGPRFNGGAGEQGGGRGAQLPDVDPDEVIVINRENQGIVGQTDSEGLLMSPVPIAREGQGPTTNAQNGQSGALHDDIDNGEET